MSEAQEKAKRNYEHKRVKMTVSFNSEIDQQRLNFAKNINFSEWVKRKIDEEIFPIGAVFQKTGTDKGENHPNMAHIILLRPSSDVNQISRSSGMR